MKVNEYEFIDTRTGEKFIGSNKEFCQHIKTPEATFRARLKAGKFSRKLLGRKDDGKVRPKRVMEYTDVATGQVFIGTRAEAPGFFKLSNSQFQRRKQQRLIRAKFVRKEDLTPKPSKEELAERERVRKLKRKANREYYHQRAIALESEEEYVN
ncbi:hypothetical protein [Streptococcus gallolyticus]|uniref:hypothetical protein n=1 Tax=Streptococcus gallolyticus TaxID=315405 RepID=UPI002284745E|nr:hypothetical protein [Streptococcus gallolyticus]MCY7156240.1 hypothetical protein [Streptococcus gallolyticus subsp. gallolyticus]